MRILIHGINYAPEQTGIGKYTAEMAGWLASRGHDVRVITAPPYYPAWRVAEGFSPWQYRREQREGVGVWRCPLWVPRRPSGARRLIHLASFAVCSAPILFAQFRWRPDVVMVVEPTLFCAPQAWLLARLSRARAWLHVQDFEVEAAFALGLLPFRTLRRLATALEGTIMRHFDRVSTISARMRERIEAKGVPAERAVLLPNWLDLDEIYPLSDTDPERAELGIPPTTLVAMYAGNMGKKQGLEVLIDAAEALSSRPDILFLLCGTGSAREDLIARAAHRSNVRFLPLQPKEKLNTLLNLADVHLLPQRANAANLVMPSKLTGMLASGRPVIAAVDAGTEVAELVRECGIVVPPEDPERLAAAIGELAVDPDRRRSLGQAGRRHAEHSLSRDAILGRLEETLAALVAPLPPM